MQLPFSSVSELLLNMTTIVADVEYVFQQNSSMNVFITKLIYLIQSANQTCWQYLQWNLMNRVWFALVVYWLIWNV